MKNRIPFLPDVDTSLACFDCGVPLDLVDSWEPCMRLDPATQIRNLHVGICASCIADSEDVATYDTMRVIFKLAKRERRRRDARLAALVARQINGIREWARIC